MDVRIVIVIQIIILWKAEKVVAKDTYLRLPNFIKIIVQKYVSIEITIRIIILWKRSIAPKMTLN